MEIAWQPSTVVDKNGDIQGYVICAREASSVTCPQNKTYTDSNERKKWIEDLKPYTEYVIEIASFNVAGEGSSISVVHRTEQAGSLFLKFNSFHKEKKNHHQVLWLDSNKGAFHLHGQTGVTKKTIRLYTYTSVRRLNSSLTWFYYTSRISKLSSLVLSLLFSNGFFS